MVTEAQKWARKRNWTKAQLKGIRAQLHGMMVASYYGKSVLTPSERMAAEKADSMLEAALEDWNERNQLSKERYLNGKP
jgi:hypothetical protein